MAEVATATATSNGRLRSTAEEAAYYLGMAKLAQDRGRVELARHYLLLAGRDGNSPPAVGSTDSN